MPMGVINLMAHYVPTTVGKNCLMQFMSQHVGILYVNYQSVVMITWSKESVYDVFTCKIEL